MCTPTTNEHAQFDERVTDLIFDWVMNMEGLYLRALEEDDTEWIQEMLKPVDVVSLRDNVYDLALAWVNWDRLDERIRDMKEE